MRTMFEILYKTVHNSSTSRVSFVGLMLYTLCSFVSFGSKMWCDIASRRVGPSDAYIIYIVGLHRVKKIWPFVYGWRSAHHLPMFSVFLVTLSCVVSWWITFRVSRCCTKEGSSTPIQSTAQAKWCTYYLHCRTSQWRKHDRLYTADGPPTAS